MVISTGTSMFIRTPYPPIAHVAQFNFELNVSFCFVRAVKLELTTNVKIIPTQRKGAKEKEKEKNTERETKTMDDSEKGHRYGNVSHCE